MSTSYLNLISEGSNGDHHVLGFDRSLFKANYSKPMNFGMQKYEISADKKEQLHQDKEAIYTFTINPSSNDIGDLLLDTHLVVVLPNIWSPIHADNGPTPKWRPFEFKWIPKLGANIVREVVITIDNHVVQRFDGYYLQNIVEREFDDAKRRQFYEMIGHVPELNDPANAYDNGGNYPNASHGDYNASDGMSLEAQIEPSIRSRTLVIPLMGWYSFSTKQAVPLRCMQNHKMVFTVRLRPAREWYVTKNVGPRNPSSLSEDDYQKLKPHQKHPTEHSARKHFAPIHAEGNNAEAYYLRRFVTQPYDFKTDIPDYFSDAATAHYKNLNVNLIQDVYMVATTAMLTREEVTAYVRGRKEYLFKQIQRIEEEAQTQTQNRKEIESAGLVANVSLFFQRNDVEYRNEFSNYTNWSYSDKRESPLVDYSVLTGNDIVDVHANQYRYDGWDLRRTDNPTAGPIPADPSLRTTGGYNTRNDRRILRTFKFFLAGREKDKEFESKIITNIDTFTRSNGGSATANELYFYSFELNSDPCHLSPTGFMNTDFYSRFELDYTLFPPAINREAKYTTLCDFENNIIWGTEKSDRENKYLYNYHMYIYIERYNKIVFENGEVKLIISPV